MKKIKKFFWRFFPLVVCCCIIFSFSNYASAASYTGIDYQNYITDIVYNGDSKYITAYFNTGLNYVELKQFGNIIKQQYSTGDFVVNYSSLTPIEDNNYTFTDISVVILPFGTQNMLKLNNIPNNTALTYKFRMEYYRHGSYGLDYYFDCDWYDSNFNFIKRTNVASGDRSSEYPAPNNSSIINFEIPVTIEKPDRAEYLRIRCVMDMSWTTSGNNANFSIYSGGLKLVFKESALREISGQNEIIIDRLDDMINGTPSQNQQVQNDVNKLEDSSDKLNDLTEQMVVPKPSIGAEDVAVENLADPTDISLVNQPLTILWENPTILGMVTIIFTLILVSWVFFGKK